MKKIFVLVFVVALVSLGTFFGIKKFKKNNTSGSHVVSNFKSEAILNIEDKIYGCEFSRSDSLTEILFQDPKTVDGLKISWENGKQIVSFKEIKKETDHFMIPEDSFLNLVVKILDSINSIEVSKTDSDGKYTSFKGNIENHEFNFIADDNGYIKELNIPCKKAKISFDYENKL